MRTLYRLVALIAFFVSSALHASYIQFTWYGDASAPSGVNYVVGVDAMYSIHTEIYKNGYLLAQADSAYVEATTSDVGAQNVEYYSLGYSEGWYEETSEPHYVEIIQNLVPPTVPEGLAVSAVTASSLKLKWDASRDDNYVSLYEVERNGVSLGTTSSSNTAWQMTGLSEATNYTFRVRARDSFLNWSAWSNPLAVTTLDVSPPSAPASISVSGVSRSTASITWPVCSDNVGVTGYEVRLGDLVYATPTANSAAIGGLRIGDVYTITVRARDAAGNWSAGTSVSYSPSEPNGALDIEIRNQTYGSGQSPSVFATGRITTLPLTPGDQTETPSVVAISGSNVTYTAGSRIVLGDGFRVNNGATFAARINRTDTDGDGMSDLWETTFGLNPNSANSITEALLDNDGDGLSNVAEYNLGYDPTVADSGTAQLGGSIPANWPTVSTTRTEAVGITAGELSVGPSGGASYSVALWATPGTAGMEPKLSLNYNSQGGPGIAGMGWSLSGASAITRGPKTLAVDGVNQAVEFSNNDQFYLDGQRLILISGTHAQVGAEYRTEVESFSRIKITSMVSPTLPLLGPASFKVWTKAGLIMEFGGTVGGQTNSRFPVTGRSEIRAWSVSKISDTSGNYMEYVYGLDSTNGEQWLERINYTGHEGTSPVTPYASVRFAYEGRTDSSTGFMRGAKFSATKRLKYVRSFYGESCLRTYTLTYTFAGSAHRSLLDSLTETGQDGSSFPVLDFGYSTSTYGWTSASTWTPPVPITKGNAGTGAGFVDLDGDGYPDLVEAHYLDGVTTSRAWLNRPSGWVETPSWALPYALQRGSEGSDRGARFVDVNGDGRVDFVVGWKDAELVQTATYLNTGSGWQHSPTWTLPTFIRKSNDDGASKHRHFLDINGDGRVDFVFNNGTAEQGAYLNTGSGWSYSAAFIPPFISTFNSHAIFLDINGDGLPDQLKRQVEGASGSFVALNTGSGWNVLVPNTAEHTKFQAPRALSRYHDATVAENVLNVFGVEAVDINGDGLTDLVYHDEWNNGDAATYLNTGNGWVRSYAFNSGIPFGNRGPNYGAAMLDLNADGLPDIVRREGNYGSETKDMRLNIGTGFSLGDPNLTVPFRLDRSSGSDSGRTGSEIVDINADGVPDQVWHRINDGVLDAKGAMLNTARPHNLLTTVTNGFGITATITYTPLTSRDGSGNLRIFAPANDSLVATNNDVSRAIGPSLVVEKVSHQDGVGGSYDITYAYGGLRSHRIYGSLGYEWTSVTDSRTNIVSTTVNSQESTNQPDGRISYPDAGMPVTTFTQTAGGGAGNVTLSESSTEYVTKWWDRGYQPGSSTNKIYTRMTFALTSTSTSRDLDGSVTAQSTTTTRGDVDGQTVDFDDYGNSKYLKVETGGGYYKETINVYTNTVDATRWHLGRLSSTEVRSVGPDDPAPGLVRKSAFTYDPTTGFLKTEDVEPGHAGAAAGTPERTYWAKTTYVYDEFGNKTFVTTQANDVTSRTAETHYDAQGRFPDWTENALDHRTLVTAHSWWGAVESATDPNGITVATEFDGFGRAKKQTTTGASETAIVGETFRRWAPGVGGAVPSGALYYVESTATMAAPGIEFFDSFGRSIRKLGIDADGRPVATDTYYDLMGRAYKSSTPFVIGQQSAGYTETLAFDLLNRPLVVRTPDEEQTAAETVTISRSDPGPESFNIPAGYVATTFQYNGLTSRVSRRQTQGVARIVNRATNNSQGWEIEVVQNAPTDGLPGGVDIDPQSAEQATVRKTYDALGQVKKSTVCSGMAASGVTIHHGYDLRGRRVWTYDPDMCRALNSGESPGAAAGWTYKYNGLGELVEQTDAEGQKTYNEYDILGRPSLRIVYNSQGTIEERAEWAYDNAVGAAKGKLHYALTKNVASTEMYRETYVYDQYSRVLTATRSIQDSDVVSTTAKTNYTSSVEYDTFGRVLRLVYPTGVKVRQAYNAFSVLKEVRRQLGGTEANNDPIVWMALPDTTNGASLAESRYLLGNGVTTTRLTSRATGRLRNLDAGILGGAGLQAIDLDYDRAGNVLRRHDQAIGLDDVAWYDALNRLTGFTSVQGYQLDDMDVHYDALGNITWKTGVGSYTYGGSRPHAVTSTNDGSTAKSYQYNANGAMTSGSGRLLSYTAFNQTRTISSGGTYSTFWFGGSHERVGQKSDRGILIYGSGSYEKFTPASGTAPIEHTHYIMTPAGRTAAYKTYSNGTVPEMRYFHTDHLGSVTLIAGEKGGVIQRFRYDPWGKRLGATAGPTAWMTLSMGNNGGFRRGFTDHEHLEDIGLIHMNGRIFDPVLSRFLSADPNIDGVSDSQGYNRYSYVHNNPLNATDPSGYLTLREIAPAVIGVVVTAIAIVAFGPSSLAADGFFKALLVGVGKSYAIGAAAVGGFASAFSGSLLSGGSVGDAFKAGVIGAAVGAATAWASQGIGGFFDEVSDGIWNTAGRMLAHGTVGGLASEAQGGQFRHGFYGSAASTGFMRIKGLRNLMGTRDSSRIALRTAVAATIGGTASALSGGKFANGAVTSAFQHLFNSEAANREDETRFGFFIAVLPGEEVDGELSAKRSGHTIYGLTVGRRIVEIYSFGPAVDIAETSALISQIFETDASVPGTMRYSHQPNPTRYFADGTNVHFRVFNISIKQFLQIKWHGAHQRAIPPDYSAEQNCTSLPVQTGVAASIGISASSGMGKSQLFFWSREHHTPNALVRDLGMKRVADGSWFYVGGKLLP